MNEKCILKDYEKGSPLTLISNKYHIPTESLKEILRNYAEKNKVHGSFTKEFQTVIANRDKNGGMDITRKSIAKELHISQNTIKKACEKFGNYKKDEYDDAVKYTKVIGNFTKDKCPTCNSSRVNMIDDNTIYCLNCGDEHIFDNNDVFRISWEYID